MCRAHSSSIHIDVFLCAKHTHTHTRPCEEKAKMVTVTRECVPHDCSMPLPRILSMSQVGFNLLHPAALMNCFLSFHGSVTHRRHKNLLFQQYIESFKAEVLQAAACAKNLPRLAALRAGLRTRMLRRPRSQSLPATANAQKYMFKTCVNCPNCWTVMNPLKGISYTCYYDLIPGWMSIPHISCLDDARSSV